MSTNLHPSYQLCDLAAVRVTGPLETRLRMSINHLLAERGRILGGEGFGSAWGADQQGRWLGAVALASAYTGEAWPALAETAAAFYRTQAPSGFFGTAYNSLTWWGAGRGLIGLVEYWQATHDAAGLEAATRLGEFYLGHFPLEGPGLTTHHGGHKEGLVALAQATGRAEFVELAKKIPATEAEAFGLPGQSPAGSQHTHSFLTALRGCVDLYLATGLPEYLQRAQRQWAHVRRHHMWVTGGISEGSTYAFETRDETCSVADWLRLSLKLWQATGQPEYLDVAEHVLLNHLGFDQDHSGGFCSYRSVGENPAGQVRDVVTWFCCSMHGLRAMLEAVRFIFAQADNGIAVNLYISATATLRLRDQAQVRLTQTAESPVGPVRILVEPDSPHSFALHLRVPAWTRGLTVTVNGAPVDVQSGQPRVTLWRAWQPGDVVEITWKPVFKLVPAGSNGWGAADDLPAALPEAAVIYGPLVLMVDPTLNIYAFWEAGPVEIAVPRTAAGAAYLPPISAPILGRGALASPGTGFVTLARPRGATAEPGLLAFLVPIAELTDRWSFSFGRHTPYEVRNDVTVLPAAESAAFANRVAEQFAAFVQQRRADTATEQA